MHMVSYNLFFLMQDTWNWPVIAPLPSYGRGRERPGGRYISFIHGDRLRDVVITGESQLEKCEDGLKDPETH